MPDVTPEVEAVRVTEIEHQVASLSKIYRVDARMYVPAQRYSTGIYRVKVLGSVSLMNEYLMDDGKLSFDTLKEGVKAGDRFQIYFL
jgi:hypothetical protein